MNVDKRLGLMAGILVLAVLACSFPGVISTENQIRTQIALTQTARPASLFTTQENSLDATQTITLEPTLTLEPEIMLSETDAPMTPTHTNTPAADNSAADNSAADQSAADCNIATFVKDVTVPDGTKFSSGESFEKTWRLKNIGTCTWTTAYEAIFVSGEQMGGPEDVNFTQDIAPGETVDISVNLTAPNTAGEYRGNWKLRSSDDVVFGLTTGKPFYVEIIVKAQ